MNVVDLMQILAIVLNANYYGKLLKIDIAEMTWKHIIDIVLVLFTVMYLPFPYGILLQVICQGVEILVGHLSKTSSTRPENEKPGNEKLNSKFTIKIPFFSFSVIFKSTCHICNTSSILGKKAKLFFLRIQ